MAATVTSQCVSVERKEFIERVKLAEQAERYEDMVAIVKGVLETTGPIEFSAEERNLFSVAFKNVVGMKRASWRIIRAIEENTSNEGSAYEKKQQMAKEYREKIKSELVEVAQDVLLSLDNKLLPACKDTESQVFYTKMKADYSRYLAEVYEGVEREKSVATAHKHYEQALELSSAKMSSTHPLRLGLVLNYSVFYYEQLGDKDKANALARSAFDGAISQLDTLNEESYKDSTLVLQLIRDNLSLWANETACESETDHLIEMLEGTGLQGPRTTGVQDAAQASADVVPDPVAPSEEQPPSEAP